MFISFICKENGTTDRWMDGRKRFVDAGLDLLVCRVGCLGLSKRAKGIQRELRDSFHPPPSARPCCCPCHNGSRVWPQLVEGPNWASPCRRFKREHSFSVVVCDVVTCVVSKVRSDDPISPIPAMTCVYVRMYGTVSIPYTRRTHVRTRRCRSKNKRVPQCQSLLPTSFLLSSSMDTRQMMIWWCLELPTTYLPYER